MRDCRGPLLWMMVLAPPARQFSFGTAAGIATRGSVTMETDSACQGGQCLRIDAPAPCSVAAGASMRVAIRDAATVRIRMRAAMGPLPSIQAYSTPIWVSFHALDSDERASSAPLQFHADSASPTTFVADWQTIEVAVPADLRAAEEVGVSILARPGFRCGLQSLSVWLDTLDLN